MMKNIVLLALVITIAVASEINPENDKCEASSVFYVQCNKCRCANDGNGAICTRQQCIPGEYNEHGVLIQAAHNISRRSYEEDYLIVIDEKPEECEPGMRYKLDSNICVCTRYASLICPGRKYYRAQSKRSVRNDYPDLPEGNCEFGKTYRKDCNTCFCGKMGVTACTMKDCGVDIVYYSRNSRSANENWGPQYNQGDLCEPGKKFLSECNECLCNNDSKSAVCTLRNCPPHHDE